MFRRLAESFDGSPHIQYLQDQATYYDTLPHMIPAGTSGIPGFSKAIQSADTTSANGLQEPIVSNADQIFRQVVSPEIQALGKQCSTASLDDLQAAGGNKGGASLGCGWLYTPPVNGSPYPQVSQGFLGNEQGPVTGLGPPEYRKWFFDLQLAKKQTLLDKCKALKACTDVDSEVFKGACGYCTETQQGVPIDAVGSPLYPDVAGCTKESIVRTRNQCPPPPSVDAGNGPQPIVDRTCEPAANGQLSSSCLYRMVLTGGCRDSGSLAVALSGGLGTSPNDYVQSLRDSDTVKVYNRVAHPPLALDIFTQGKTTTDQVLREVKQIATAASAAAPTSALGAAARDLCLQKGALAQYDVCSDLADSTPPPFDLTCLQRLFLIMGGQPKATMYPTAANLSWWNQLGSIGAVKQRIQQLAANTSSSTYDIQRESMIQFLGIQPEQSVRRAPYQQGVEVFWFVPTPGNPQRVQGFLRRTIERDIVQLQAGPSRVAQIGGGAFGCMLQMMDVRAANDFAVKFNVTVDDGFWIAVNQPAAIDKSAMTQVRADSPGLFENLGLQGPTAYSSVSCTPFKAATPNIMKLFFEDAGGGWNAFQFGATLCSGSGALQAPYYSLTCESRAPFLTYELGSTSGVFEEVRNPGLFSQFLGLQNLEVHARPEEKESVPGRKGFVRINNANSLIDMYNIAFQSWKSMTVAIRLKSMPVKDTLLKLVMRGGYASVVAVPISGSACRLSIEHNIGGTAAVVPTGFQLQANQWYVLMVQNTGTELKIGCGSVADVISSRGSMTTVQLTSSQRLFSDNGTWAPAPGQPQEPCTVMMGTKGFAGRGDWPSMYGSSVFEYDLAWIHFFQQYVTNEDMVRECQANWIYTQFPKSYGIYR